MMLFLTGMAVGSVAGLVGGVAAMCWATPDESGTLRELREAGRRQHGG